jgi:hypothetical protein
VLKVAFGPIDVGETLTVVVTLRFASPGNFTSSVSVTGLDADPATNNNTVTATTVVSPVPLTTFATLQPVTPKRGNTELILTFAGTLDPTRASKVSEYRLIAPGRDGRFGTRDDVVIPIRSASVDAAHDELVVVLSRRISKTQRYRFTVNGSAPSGLTDTLGRLIDGNQSGQEGSNYVTEIGPAPRPHPKGGSTPKLHNGKARGKR